MQQKPPRHINSQTSSGPPQHLTSLKAKKRHRTQNINAQLCQTQKPSNPSSSLFATPPPQGSNLRESLPLSKHRITVHSFSNSSAPSAYSTPHSVDSEKGCPPDEYHTNPTNRKFSPRPENISRRLNNIFNANSLKQAPPLLPIHLIPSNPSISSNQTHKKTFFPSKAQISPIFP